MAGWMAVVLVTVALAAHADLAGGIGPVATVADLGVGLAFIGGAAVAPGSWRCRSLFAGVGLAWLLGSLVPVARLAYLPVLVIALATFPSGRLRSARDRIAVALSVVAPLVVAPALVLATLLAGVAMTGWIGRRWERMAVWFPSLAASAVAIVIAASWLAESSGPAAYDPGGWLLALELVLVVVAGAFPVGAWAVARERDMLADRLLGDDGVASLDSLGALLAATLGDPRMRLLPWDVEGGRYVGAPGSVTDLVEGAFRLAVDDGNERLAVIVHGGTAAMQDPTIVGSVVESVRLTVINQRRQVVERAQLVEMNATRGRLLAAIDRQRAATAARLRDEVIRPIEEAAAGLREIGGPAVPKDARDALVIASQELDAAASEILALIGGVPPANLGQAGLASAIEQLASRCPIPVSVTAELDAAADPRREATLFYVCSEALANAIKHAGATRISIDLRRDVGDLVITIVDDGVGGAKASGSGLRGLADRLAVFGGRLRVDSPPGVGTTLSARISPS